MIVAHKSNDNQEIILNLDLVKLCGAFQWCIHLKEESVHWLYVYIYIRNIYGIKLV